MKRFVSTLSFILFMSILGACTKEDAPIIVAKEHDLPPLSLNGKMYESVSLDFSHIEDDTMRWQAYDLDNYIIKQDLTCFCICTTSTAYLFVQNDVITKIIAPSTGEDILADNQQCFFTVNQLTSLIATMNETAETEKLAVEYHSRFGFPTFLSINQRADIEDDELAVENMGLWLLND